MDFKQCIAQRRSIRKYKKDDIEDHILYELLDYARLAPSACNSQPWRFKIIKDPETKQTLSQLAFNQKHIADAPVVIVCCAHIKDYVNGSLLGTEELHNLDMIDADFYKLVKYRTNGLSSVRAENLVSEVSFSVTIAIEHIALGATALGLGSCWVKIADAKKIRELFGWDENLQYVSLLTLGYPAETPKPLRKLSLKEILL